MALPASGSISMAQVAAELGISATGLSFNDSRVRALAGVPSGAIQMAILRGKQAGPTYSEVSITTGIDNVTNVGINTIVTPYSSEIFGSFTTNGTLSFGTLVSCFWIANNGGGEGIYLDITGVTTGAGIEIRLDDGNATKPVTQILNRSWYYFDLQYSSDTDFLQMLNGMTDGFTISLGFRKV